MTGSHGAAPTPVINQHAVDLALLLLLLAGPAPDGGRGHGFAAGLEDADHAAGGDRRRRPRRGLLLHNHALLARPRRHRSHLQHAPGCAPPANNCPAFLVRALLACVIGAASQCSCCSVLPAQRAHSATRGADASCDKAPASVKFARRVAAAGLISFTILKPLSAWLVKMGWSKQPFTPQENTVAQTMGMALTGSIWCLGESATVAQSTFGCRFTGLACLHGIAKACKIAAVLRQHMLLYLLVAHASGPSCVQASAATSSA